MNRNGHRGLRRRLEFTLVGVALVSVLLLAGLNYVFARVLIADSVEAQLSALRDTRVQAIESSASRIRTEIGTLAVTPSVITALEDLSDGYGALDGALTAAQRAELESAYDEALDPLRESGLELATGSLLPTSDSGQYVQYHYIADNPDDFDDRDRLDDAGDGSEYSRAHAEHHPLLRSLMRSVGVTDLMLVDVTTGEVVYSVQKRIDVGTGVIDGPWANNALGSVVDGLARATVGDTVISDTTFYVPARGQAVVFIATAIRSGSGVTGAVVAELPVDAITELVTSGQDWESIGLGESGDIYLVGADGTLRTDTRRWTADPEGFLSDHLARNSDEALVDRMRLAGSAALTQRVDNAAVDAGVAGDSFVGTVTNYRGDTTFAASGPVDIGGQDWIVVIEQDRSEANSGLRALLRGMLVVIAILIPITAVLGWWMARSLTRPFGLLVDAAGRIARGEPATGVADIGNNELGDVGRQLEVVASRLEAEEAAIVAEEAQINDVLGAVVPPRLIDRVRSGEQDIEDVFDTATVISFLVDGIPEAIGPDQDTVFEIAEQLADGVDRLCDEYEIERVRRSSTNALFVAGLSQPDARSASAAEFAAAVMGLVEATGADYGQPLSVRAGLAAGDVASGVIGQQQLAFSVWGEPVTAAFTLASLAQPGEILAEVAVSAALDARWAVEERVGLPGLDDDVEACSISLPVVVEP
jgi:class 3 adenylate cyclase